MAPSRRLILFDDEIRTAASDSLRSVRSRGKNVDPLGAWEQRLVELQATVGVTETKDGELWVYRVYPSRYGFEGSL